MSVRPLVFTLTSRTTTTLQEIVAAMLIVENWRTFTGWGPLPGIRDVEIVRETVGVVDTTFRVTNTDGTQHTETIREWDGGTRLTIEMQEFPRRLSWMAKRFVERWTQIKSSTDEAHHVLTRTIEIYPTSWSTRILMVPVRFMMKRALIRHSAQVLV